MAKDISTAIINKQITDLKLQAAKLSQPVSDKFGEQLTQQATQLQTPNASSAVLKAIALGMGGQAQNKVKKSKEETNARMAEILNSQLEIAQQLKAKQEAAAKDAAVEAYIADNGGAILNTLEQAITPNTTPEAIAQANNTLTNILQSGGKNLGVGINNASIDPTNQRIIANLADGSSTEMTFPEFISTVSKANPELGKDAMNRLYPSVAQRKGEGKANQVLSERDALVQGLKDRGVELTPEQEQALRMGTNIQANASDLGLSKKATDKSQTENVIQFQNASKVQDSINRVKKFIAENPEAIGAGGQVRKFAGAISGLINPISEEFKIDITDGLVDKGVIKEMQSLGSSTSALETMETMLAYQMAKAADPSGRVSDADFRAAKASINLTGLLARPESIKAQLDMVESANRDIMNSTKKFISTPLKDNGQVTQEVQNLLDKYK